MDPFRTRDYTQLHKFLLHKWEAFIDYWGWELLTILAVIMWATIAVAKGEEKGPTEYMLMEVFEVVTYPDAILMDRAFPIAGPGDYKGCYRALERVMSNWTARGVGDTPMLKCVPIMRDYRR